MMDVKDTVQDLFCESRRASWVTILKLSGRRDAFTSEESDAKIPQERYNFSD